MVITVLIRKCRPRPITCFAKKEDGYVTDYNLTSDIPILLSVFVFSCFMVEVWFIFEEFLKT